MERAIWTHTVTGATSYFHAPMSPLLVLIVAVLATTYAGPIVRFAAAPALAIAFWRLVLVLPVTGGLAVLEGSREPGAGSRISPVTPLPAPGSPLPLMTLSGLLLALHFWSWIASLRFTAVASSVVLVSLKSVFAWGFAAVWLREHPTRTEAWGIVLAVIGASLIGLGDARLSLGAFGGDVLALLGAVTGAGYYVIGRRVRQTVGIWRYATGVYAVAAAALALLALARRTPLVGFAGRDWAVFGPMPTAVDRAKLFAETVVTADGMCLDAEGAIWVADALHFRLLRVAEGGRIGIGNQRGADTRAGVDRIAA